MILLTLSSPKKLFVILDFTMLETLFYNGLLWFPYYFTVIGYEGYSSYFTSGYVVATCLGTLSFESIIKWSGIDANKFMILIISLMTLVQFTLMGVGFVGEDTDSTILVYFFLCPFLGFIISGPWTRICSS